MIFISLSVTVSKMTSKIMDETVKDPGDRKKLNTLWYLATCKINLRPHISFVYSD